jgi:hypothetical protein
VDAFTAQTIEAAGIEMPRDFVCMVPNMTLVEVQCEWEAANQPKRDHSLGGTA